MVYRIEYVFDKKEEERRNKEELVDTIYMNLADCPPPLLTPLFPIASPSSFSFVQSYLLEHVKWNQK